MTDPISLTVAAGEPEAKRRQEALAEKERVQEIYEEADRVDRENTLEKAAAAFQGPTIAAGEILDADSEKKLNKLIAKKTDEIRGLDSTQQVSAAQIIAKDIVETNQSYFNTEHTTLEKDKLIQRIWFDILAGLTDRDDTPTLPERGNSGNSRNKQKHAAAGELEQTEQAYLLQNIDNIKVDQQAPGPDQLPRLIVVNTEGNLLNKLTSSKTLGSLMGASSKDVSSLTPFIRIAKRDKNPDGTERVREFKFSSHSPDLRTYFAKGSAAGREVGLKSFDFETTGQNFFTATRSLKGSMVLFFKSFADLDTGGDTASNEEEMPWTELLFNYNFAALDPLDDAVPHDSIDSVLDELEAQALAKDSPDRKAEIFVEIGYNYSTNALASNAALRQAVDSSRILLSIYPITTDFNFREDGAVELTITFTASAETSGDTAAANVLTVGSGAEELAKIDNLKKKVTIAQANLSDEEGDGSAKTKLENKLEATKEAYNKKLKGQKLSNYAKFIKYVYDIGRLYSFTISNDQYHKGILPDKKSNKVKVTQAAISALITEGKTKALQGKGLEKKERKRGQRTIAYFYLGDLINYYATALIDPADLATHGVDIYSPNPLIPQSREVVVGDYVFHIFPKKEPPIKGATPEDIAEFKRDVKARRINLSKLPISVSMFNSFMYKRVMKHSSDILTFDSFLKWAVMELIDNALDSFVEGRKWKALRQAFSERRVSVSMSTVTGKAAGLLNERTNPPKRFQFTGDALTALGPAVQGALDLDGVPAEEAHKFEIRPSSMDEIILHQENDYLAIKVEDARSFTIIHGSRIPAIGNDANPVGANEDEDQAKGIYHLSPGLDRGIVKNVSFTQQSSRIREINLLKSLDSGANPGVGILKMPYDAEVKIFGNPTFYPGQFVVINPAVVGVGTLASRNSIANKLGLGGLYAIISVQTRLSSGLLESTLTCKWNNYKPKVDEAPFGTGTSSENYVEEQ